MHITTLSRLMTTGSLIGLVAAALPYAAQAQSAGASAVADDTIIVTARKREETLIEVPLAVSVFDQGAIQDRAIRTVAELSAFTPGFDFQNTGQGGATGRDNPNIRFRGVAVQNENPASRAGAVFWEGSYMSGGAGLIPLFDLKRAEVIKGPQNAFFGRNTFAGAVNFIAAEPGKEIEGFVNAIYSPSDQDTYVAQGAISLPINDKLGVRVGASYRRNGADFTYRNGDPINQEDTTSLQATILYDNGEGIRLKTTGFWVDASDTNNTVSMDFTKAPGECNLTFAGDIFDIKTRQIIGSFNTNLAQSTRGTFCGQLPNYDNPNGFNVPYRGSFAGGGTIGLDAVSPSVAYVRTLPPEAANYSIPTPPNGLGNSYRTWLINQTADIEIGTHTLSGILSYGQNGSYRIRDALDGQNTRVGGLKGTPAQQLRLSAFAFYSHDIFAEARIASPTDGRLRYMLGFSYYQGASRTFEFLQTAGLGGLNAQQPLVFINSKVYGVFGSVDYEFIDNLTLSLEGRYGNDKVTTLYNGPTERDGPQPTAVRNVSQSFTRFMPRVLLSYSPNQQLNVYGSWALSYLQGSDTNAFTYAQRVPQAGIDPNDFGVFTPVQRLSAFEIGVKAAPMNNLSFSIAGYYMDWQNQVQFELSPTFVALFSAGDSRYKGIEAEVTYAPVNWLILEGNFNYVDATLTRFNGAGSTANAVLFPGLLAGQQISSVGNRPRYIPEWSGALAGTLRFGRMFDLERDVNLRVDGVYFGQIFEDNFEYNSITGFWRFNARFSTEVTKQLRVDLYGLNLTNNLNFTSAGGTTNGTLGNTVPFQTRKTFGTLPRAREVGLEVLFKF